MSQAPVTHDHRARRDRIRRQLRQHGIDGLVVTHTVDVRWLTGLVASWAQVLISRDPAADLLWTDGRYAEPAQATGMVVEQQNWVQVLGEGGPSVVGGARLGFQAEHLTVHGHDGLAQAMDGIDLVATKGVLAMARRVKDPSELALIERACQITSDGWSWLVEHVDPGMTERQVARSLVRHLEDLGAQGPAFDPIVASGPNSAIPHHRPTDRPLQTGELLKVDFGAKVDGYHADCTRVLSFGDPGAQLRAVHEAVLAAQQAGVRAAVVGASAQDVHDAAVGELEELALGPTLHGVGHGLGLEIHETPILTSEPTATLESGFVVTVEPGIYLSGLGGVRIEDTVVVTPDGPQILTTCARDLVVL